MNLAILISDGEPHPPERRGPALVEAQALKAAGVVMIAVGVTFDIDIDFLKSVSSQPQIEGQNFFSTASFSALSGIRRAVGEGACQAVEGLI